MQMQWCGVPQEISMEVSQMLQDKAMTAIYRLIVVRISK